MFNLGCVRETFFGPKFSLVRVIIRFGANMSQKKFDPVGQYFPLRKCDGSSDPQSRYMKKKKISRTYTGLYVKIIFFI